MEDGLASICDLIQQVDYLTPLEGQLTHSKAENVNLRRHFKEHTAVNDLLREEEQDRDQAMAEHRSILDTINSAILGSRSSTLTARPTPKGATLAG